MRRALWTGPLLPGRLRRNAPFLPRLKHGASWRGFGEVRRKLRWARELADATPAESAAAVLGNGTGLSAQDTVPFVLWCAGSQLANYEEALWLTVSGLGGRDTTCAMVGGIVVLYTGVESIPLSWLQARESLPVWPFSE